MFGLNILPVVFILIIKRYQFCNMIQQQQQQQQQRSYQVSGTPYPAYPSNQGPGGLDQPSTLSVSTWQYSTVRGGYIQRSTTSDQPSPVSVGYGDDHDHV